MLNDNGMVLVDVILEAPDGGRKGLVLVSAAGRSKLIAYVGKSIGPGVIEALHSIWLNNAGQVLYLANTPPPNCRQPCLSLIDNHYVDDKLMSLTPGGEHPFAMTDLGIPVAKTVGGLVAIPNVISLPDRAVLYKGVYGDTYFEPGSNRVITVADTKKRPLTMSEILKSRMTVEDYSKQFEPRNTTYVTLPDGNVCTISDEAPLNLTSGVLRGPTIHGSTMLNTISTFTVDGVTVKPSVILNASWNMSCELTTIAAFIDDTASIQARPKAGAITDYKRPGRWVVFTRAGILFDDPKAYLDRRAANERPHLRLKLADLDDVEDLGGGSGFNRKGQAAFAARFGRTGTGLVSSALVVATPRNAPEPLQPPVLATTQDQLILSTKIVAPECRSKLKWLGEGIACPQEKMGSSLFHVGRPDKSSLPAMR